MLPDGKILLTGSSVKQFYSSIILYDPVTFDWSKIKYNGPINLFNSIPWVIGSRILIFPANDKKVLEYIPSSQSIQLADNSLLLNRAGNFDVIAIPANWFKNADVNCTGV